MKLFINQIPKLSKSILAIGAFDGLHKGHRFLIENARIKAEMTAVPLVVYTFDPPPKVYFQGQNQLISLEQKVDNLFKLGVDYTVVASFTHDYSKKRKSDFIQEIKNINPIGIFVGKYFKFGYQQKGNIETLRKEFNVYDKSLLRCDRGIVISSSRIRDLKENNNKKEMKLLI